MKRTLHLLGLLLIVSHARGDLLIQRVIQVSKYTGSGVERTIPSSGYFINDLDGTNGVAIFTASINGHKLYQLLHEGDASTIPLKRLHVTGPNGRSYTVLTTGTTETNDTQVSKITGILLRGLDNTIPIRDGRTLNYPRVLRGSKFKTELVNGDYRLTEETATRVFSQTETLTANKNSETADMVAQRIVRRLEAAGYVLSPD